MPDRVALAGIIYVRRKGVAWRDVPSEVVGCSGMTAWRRLRDWTEAGVWPRLHEALLTELRAAGSLGMDDAAIDGSHTRALKGAHVGPSPVDRGRPGSKHHVIVDRLGTPLAVSLTGGNRHDVTQLIPLLNAIPRIRAVVDALATGPSGSSLTGATTTTSTAACRGSAGSSPSSPAEVSSTALASAAPAGW